MPSSFIQQRPTLEELLAEDYVVESYVQRPCTPDRGLQLFAYSHIEAFAHALHSDEAFFEHIAGDASSPNIPGTPLSSALRIRKVSALSDFAPVNLKVSRCARFFLEMSFQGFFYTELDGERKISKKNGTTGFSYSFAGHCWCVRVFKYFFCLLTCYTPIVFHISIHYG